MNFTPLLAALQLSIAATEPQEITIWANEFMSVEYHGDSWTACRAGQPDDPMPVDRRLGEYFMKDRAFGIIESWSDEYRYAFQFWTEWGEILLFRPDPFADDEDPLDFNFDG